MSAVLTSRGGLRLCLRAGRTRTRSVQRCKYRVSIIGVISSLNRHHTRANNKLLFLLTLTPIWSLRIQATSTNAHNKKLGVGPRDCISMLLHDNKESVQ